MYKYKNARHPVVVVSDVDANNQVKVATLSHNFPEDIPQKPANDYAAFGRESFIRVAPPKTVSIDHLKATKTPPYTVEPDKLQLLIDHISMCGLALPGRIITFSLPDKNCPPDQQLAGVCQSKPAHSSPDHGSSSRVSPSHGKSMSAGK